MDKPLAIANLPPGLHKAMEAMWLQEFGGDHAHLAKATLMALVKRDLVEINIVEGPDRVGILRIAMPRLTIRGHLAYCEWAAAAKVLREKMETL